VAKRAFAVAQKGLIGGAEAGFLMGGHIVRSHGFGELDNVLFAPHGFQGEVEMDPIWRSGPGGPRGKLIGAEAAWGNIKLLLRQNSWSGLRATAILDWAADYPVGLTSCRFPPLVQNFFAVSRYSAP
jgi:hypothetical protein